MPAEWEAQDAIALAWPHVASNWPEGLGPIEATFDAMVAAIADHQPVLLIAGTPACAAELSRYERRYGIERVRVLDLPTDDIWVRDYGPLQVDRTGQRVWLGYRFDGWGGKFSCDRDSRIAPSLADEPMLRPDTYHSIGLVTEGGNIESDGTGTLLTNMDCLTHPNRNKPEAAGRLVDSLREMAGFDRVIGITGVRLLGDDTDGHIDTLARFCRTDAILFATCDPGDTEQYPLLAPLEDQLAATRTTSEAAYDLLAVPLPQPLRSPDGDRLPASYLNFLITNEKVLIPIYGDPADGEAIERIGCAFPGREAVGLDGRMLVQQSGGIHCASWNLFSRGGA